jgi:high-affinity K+ transport system ATPase subunit B
MPESTKRQLFDQQSSGNQRRIRKAEPTLVAKNPVMFVVEIGSILTTLLIIATSRRARPATAVRSGYPVAVVHSVVASFAEAWPAYEASGHIRK